jgi:hypothetical protein
LQTGFYQTNGRVKHAEIDVETDTNGRQIEDVYVGMGRWETGAIRTIKIPLPNLDRDYDPSKSREIILDRKPGLNNVEMPDWIEIIPPRKPN